MNLRWDGTFHRFVAEFSSDFQGDLAAVKEAGFKTTGAPEWIWYTSKAGPLTKLRTLRPGLLTISPEARERYNSLSALEAKNEEIKAAAKKANKELKKTLAVEDKYVELVIPEKGYIDASDLPPSKPFENAYIPPPPPDTRCIICDQPVYFYEQQDPLVCLWCSKIVLDNFTEVC